MPREVERGGRAKGGRKGRACSYEKGGREALAELERLLRTRTEMTPRAIRPGAAVMEGEMEGDGR